MARRDKYAAWIAETNDDTERRRRLAPVGKITAVFKRCCSERSVELGCPTGSVLTGLKMADRY